MSPSKLVHASLRAKAPFALVRPPSVAMPLLASDIDHRRKIRNLQKIGKGPQNISSEKIGKKIGKPWQTLKNT
jgi:hypothetical protein